jgi:death on curing protein
MSCWVWPLEDVVLSIHSEQLAEHGGGEGVRDLGLLQSALARPLNLAQYGEPNLPDLAAAYAYGVARNHPFVDGNKRTAYVAAEMFLAINGVILTASDVDAVVTFLALAAEDMSEPDLAAWIRANSAAAPE